MKKVLLLLLSIVIVQNLSAQEVQSITISGKIIDSITNNPLEYATVIFKKRNSEHVFGGVTDKNGLFSFTAYTGNYSISVEFLSYKPITNPSFDASNDENFGTLKLSPFTESLSSVEINGSSGIVDFKLGKKIYNVEKDISAQSSTAAEILENAPSVSVENGIPTIRGSEATVLINGRISALSKNEALNNLQASSIKKIEVITSPSSRYSANMAGGIINIVLKKGLDNGLNSSITTTAGIQDIYGAAATINYRKDKINLYTNTSYFHREPISNTTIKNEYTENGITTGFLDETRKNIRKNNVFNTTVGLDFYIDDYSTLNIEGTYAKYNGDFNNTTTSNYSDSNNQLTNSIEQILSTEHTNDIYEFAITYDKYFEREGEAFHLDISHSKDQENNNSQLFFNDLFPILIPNPNDNELIFDDLYLINTTWQTYYVFPTGEKSTLEFGSDGTLGKVKNNYLNEIISGGSFIPNPNTSNNMHYTENWVGLYIQFIRNSDKFSYGLGLRAEFTDLTIDLKNTNEYSTQKYTDIFPTVQLEYNLNEDKILAFAYQRGIFRAGYEDLNPFELRISETVSYQGNLNLLPIYANTFELSLLNNKNSKFNFNPTLYFKNYDNITQNITVETGEIMNGVPKLLTTPINLGYLNFTGIELLSTYKPSEKVEFSSTFDFKYVKQDGVYEYTDSNNELVILDYNDTGFSGSIDLNTSIKFPFDINFQSLIKYDFLSEGAYSKRYGYAFMNASINKEIFNKKATLTLSANDIFDSEKTKRLRWTGDVNSLSNYQLREPSFLLSLTYRFNQSKKNRIIDVHKNDDEINY